MSPHGPVIWLLAGATWLVVLVPLVDPAQAPPGPRHLHHRRPAPASHPSTPRPVLDEYTGDTPASGAAWAVGPATDENEGR